MMVAASLCLALVMGVMTAWAIGNSREAERQRDEARKFNYSLNLNLSNKYIQESAFNKATKFLLEAPLERRGFEWGYLYKKANPQFLDIKNVHAVDLSPDDKKIVGARYDLLAHVIIFDAETGRILKNIGSHDQGISSIKYSPDGKNLITASYDNTAKIWDLESQKPTNKYKIGIQMGRWENGIVVSKVLPNSSAFDAGMEIGDKIITYGGTELSNGLHLLSLIQSYGDKKTEVIVLRQGSKITLNIIPLKWIDHDSISYELFQLKGHSDRVNYATYSKNEKRVVTASSDGTARIWHADTGQELLVLQHNTLVRKAEFSPDGKKVVTASSEA